MTSQQSILLTYIREYIATNDFSPSFEEMRAHLGIKSKSGIHRLILAIEEQGEISRLPARCRAIKINDSTEYQRGLADGIRRGHAMALRELGRATA